MTFIWQAVVQGAVGFVIGAGTNDLAIRWLFAMVFTRKRKAIADSVQEVVSGELMSTDKIVKRISDPKVREAFEKNFRKELDRAFGNACSFVGGLMGGIGPLLPEIVRAEARALGKVGGMLGAEFRALVAKICADQMTGYLSRNLPQIINDTRVWDIIHDSIMGLDRYEMEFLTRKVANRELRGITLWGGVIGASVGVSMCVILRLIG